MPIKPSLSDWIQFLGIKASLKTNLFLGLASIFIVGGIGVLSIYYFIGNVAMTIIGFAGLIIFYILIIKRFLETIINDADRAEELLEKIMNEDEEIDDIDKIREIWFDKEKS